MATGREISRWQDGSMFLLFARDCLCCCGLQRRKSRDGLGDGETGRTARRGRTLDIHADEDFRGARTRFGLLWNYGRKWPLFSRVPLEKAGGHTRQKFSLDFDAPHRRFIPG